MWHISTQLQSVSTFRSIELLRILLNLFTSIHILCFSYSVPLISSTPVSKSLGDIYMQLMVLLPSV